MLIFNFRKWFIVLNIINFVLEGDVWKMRIKDFIYIGYNYVVYVLKVKISWNCFLVLSDIEDKIF